MIMSRIANIILHPHHGSSRGVTLILVMGISLFLVVVALHFSHSMLMEYSSSDHDVEGKEASQAIEGARRCIEYILNNTENPGFLPDTESYDREKVAVNDAAYWLIGRADDDLTRKDEPYYGLVSEASRLNVNTATYEMLLALPGMTADLAAAIIDWRDPDSELTAGGAESEYYLLLDESYNCKNGPLESVEELRLIMGADYDILYGEDENRNGILDPHEDDGDTLAPADNTDGVLDCGLVEYLTVFSREPNKRKDGTDRINIRTQRRELENLLQETFGADRAAQLLQNAGPAMGAIQSPLEFYIRTRMTPAEFTQIEDALTAVDGEFINGLVDAGTAPAAVLACIPGVGSDKAQSLVTTRRSKSAQELESLAWVAEILGEEGSIQAGPHLTTRSYQFTADVVAVGTNGRGYRRALMIFDMSGGKAGVIYRRDMSRCGWALGETVWLNYRQAEKQ